MADPTASQQVAHYLRQEILRGRWTPGTRLPGRRVLASQLGFSLATVQEGMAQVAAEGLLHVGPRKHGTFVAERPPHLCRYRLIFPHSPGERGLFWQALEAAAHQRTTPEQAFSIFYGLSGHRDLADYQEVVDEVEKGLLAGLIFASSADELLGTPLLDAPSIPRSALAGAGVLPGIPKMCVDMVDFFDRAIDELLSRGHSRIAMLSASEASDGPESGVRRIYRRALAARGLALPTVWEQFASIHHPGGARNIMELLMHPGHADRPDALIVADDNLLSDALRGLVDAGVRTPAELQIVAMTNFPLLPTAALPVIHLGVDVPGLLDQLVARLGPAPTGRPWPDATLLPTVFAHELSPSKES